MAFTKTDNNKDIDLELSNFYLSSGIDKIFAVDDKKLLLEFAKKYQPITLNYKSLSFYFEHTAYDVRTKTKNKVFNIAEQKYIKDEFGSDIPLIEGGKLRNTNLLDFYKKYKTTKTYEGIDFFICEDQEILDSINKKNIWQGFKPEVEGNWKDVKPFFQLIWENLVSKNISQYRYLRKYLTHMFLKPDHIPGVAVVMSGSQGIGKNSFMDLISKWIYPLNYAEITNTKFLTGFNGSTEGKLVVFANEAVFAYDKTTAGIIKNFITSNSHRIERKNEADYSINNYVRLFIASNNISEAALVEEHDRRYFVLDTKDSLPKTFFEDYYNQLNNNSLAEKVMYYLKRNVNVDNFKITNFPKTKTHAEVQADKIDPCLQLLKDLALVNIRDINGEQLKFTYQLDIGEDILEIRANDLFSIYKNYIRDLGRNDHTSMTGFGLKLGKYNIKKKRDLDGVLYSVSIKDICYALDVITKNPYHSKEIKEIYKIRK